MKLLNVDNNAKTIKGQKFGYLTGVLYLAPARLSGFEVCPQRSAGCTAGCLNTAGRAVFSNVQESRIAKTKRYFKDRDGFMAQLVKEIGALVRKAERQDLIPVVRLNGTSDIPWERVRFEGKTLMERFSNVQFYDYTKVTKRAIAAQGDNWPSNYSLTFSRTENNHLDVLNVLKAGGNVAVVFSTGGDDLPSRFTPPGTFKPYKVIDGDLSDLRFKDDQNVIVGLKAKGPARKDTSGFVVPMK